MLVGDRIVLIIKDLKITKKSFAESLNISTGNLSDWINPKRSSNPSMISLTRINEIYNVNLTWLINGKGDMYSTRTDQDMAKELVKLRSENDKMKKVIENQDSLIKILKNN